MSHFATNWAIRQRGIKPGLKVVLWHLADCHNPAYGGTFPSQEYLSDQCEIPRSTLNTYLDQLETAGLIAREQRRKEGSHKQERTRYYFPFEEQFSRFSTAKPSPETGHGEADPESRNQADPSPENGDSRVQNLDRTPVREPVKEPVIEREGRERDLDGHKGHLPADLIKRVQKFVTGDGYQEGQWPKWSSSTVGHIAKQFAMLSPEDQDAACSHRDAFLAKCNREGVKKPMPVANYLRDRVWEMLPAPQAADAPRRQSDGKIVAPVFGPVYGAARMLAFLSGPVDVDLPANIRETVQASFDAQARNNMAAATRYAHGKGLSVGAGGELIFPDDFEAQEAHRRQMSEGFPEVTRLHAAARDRQHVSVSADFERLKSLCEAVPVGSDIWHDWREFHQRQGWEWLPDTGTMRVVYFPKGGPQRLGEFERAARSLLEARDHDDAA